MWSSIIQIRISRISSWRGCRIRRSSRCVKLDHTSKLMDPKYDTRAHEITQTYDQHLGPVNTITFVDENRRFVTTSDDKTIRGWDYDIPVVIKYIAEPYMHSMPAVSLHPSSAFLVHGDTELKPRREILCLPIP